MGLLGRPSSDEDITAEQFVQQNTAEARKARSKKSSKHESRQASTGKRSRKSSKSATRKQSSHASERDEDDFIKDIVAPLKAKTKN